ncbi:MAG: serine/threonine-protein kinase [Gemmatimonadota bacterium]
MSASSSEFLGLQEVVAGRYSLEREIGRGGMGIVFLARDVALERPVAIKLLPRHMAADDALRERFLREARTAAQLMHPHIIPIHAVEAHDDIVFFVMAFVEGETLAERFRRIGVMKPADAMRLMQEVAWALSYAHGRGIVHRDVKPDNILIEHASGRAMVADFGIARVANRNTLSSDGALMGTVQYMSPEQAGVEDVDGRSDVYSLGATLYFAVTGSSPVEAPTMPAMLARLMNDEPASVASLRPELPSPFAGAVMRCLAKRRDDRFPSADALAASLQDMMPRVHVLRPEIRALLREINSAVMFLVAGVAGALILSTLILTNTVPRDAWPGVALIAFGCPFLFAMVSLGGLLQIARARIPRADVDSAITDELEDMNEATRRAQSQVSERYTVRVFQGFGALCALGSPWVAYRYWAFIKIVPEAERSLEWYLPFALFAAYFVWGSTLLLSLRPNRPLPKWLKGGKGGGNYINAWPLRAIRAFTRGRVAGWMFSKFGGADVRQSPGTLPTATVLLNRVQELVALLPPDLQKRLADVLPAATALERATAALRSHIGRLDAAMGEIPLLSPAREEFTTARTRAADRLEQCVGALEVLRTDCLRLGAGLIAAEGVTAELDRVRELSTIIDAELHGIDESRRIVSSDNESN